MLKSLVLLLCWAGIATPALAENFLNCTVKDAVALAPDGTLGDVKLPRPGTRAIGTITSFVADPATGIVRLPGLADVRWVLLKGDTESPELVFAPFEDNLAAASMSIHVHRPPNGPIRFVLHQVDRVYAGTCTILP